MCKHPQHFAVHCVYASDNGYSGKHPPELSPVLSSLSPFHRGQITLNPPTGSLGHLLTTLWNRHKVAKCSGLVHSRHQRRGGGRSGQGSLGYVLLCQEVGQVPPQSTHRHRRHVTGTTICGTEMNVRNGEKTSAWGKNKQIRSRFTVVMTFFRYKDFIVT